ncbi:hypothetical protein CUC00_08320 [Prevotella intermedia]|uniref:hypothetical protein n=1 Tax=Prevotella intermedia TaxID=28131 RepID=UPI000C1C2070|nr:hypothetical protein [Prevotella intermedia]ATV32557.1 hypothetical protein CTM44_01620 [Prevotella intermedia]ATV41033.1 hypothetical protein CUC00_08320 [Prevotella intermedia]
MKVKLNNKIEIVSCEVALDGYLHTVSYQADTTDEKTAKVLQFSDNVARIIQGNAPDYVLAPQQKATYQHNGEHFTGGQWEELPDDGGMAAYSGVRKIYNMIERGEIER